MFERKRPAKVSPARGQGRHLPVQVRPFIQVFHVALGTAEDAFISSARPLPVRCSDHTANLIPPAAFSLPSKAKMV
ncbi:MAG: hypothetical protein D3917_05680 [Candidatus Electrothrix sp. AX5]|nr:hypothetical protein [Candidatus Electrothrix sp. AX5]